MVSQFIPTYDGENTTESVLRRVDEDIPTYDLESVVSSIATSQIRRPGISGYVKIVFDGESLPVIVKVGLVRHHVRSFVPRPLQCRDRKSVV